MICSLTPIHLPGFGYQKLLHLISYLTFEGIS
jgi:hypothetical protein